jgi:hypothetical protein
MEGCRRVRFVSSCILILLMAGNGLPSRAADAGCSVEYVGGTMPQFGNRVSGRVHLTDPEVLVFQAKKAGLEVPYERINLLEYGQQVGRRVLLGVAISPLLLLSKSRKHFLTISFKDEDGRQQAMVFQVHKGGVRALLAGLEARSGLKVDYQDHEARKLGGG